MSQSNPPTALEAAFARAGLRGGDDLLDPWQRAVAWAAEAWARYPAAHMEGGRLGLLTGKLKSDPTFAVLEHCMPKVPRDMMLHLLSVAIPTAREAAQAASGGGQDGRDAQLHSVPAATVPAAKPDARGGHTRYDAQRRGAPSGAKFTREGEGGGATATAMPRAITPLPPSATTEPMPPWLQPLPPEPKTKSVSLLPAGHISLVEMTRRAKVAHARKSLWADNYIGRIIVELDGKRKPLSECTAAEARKWADRRGVTARDAWRDMLFARKLAGDLNGSTVLGKFYRNTNIITDDLYRRACEEASQMQEIADAA